MKASSIVATAALLVGVAACNRVLGIDDFRLGDGGAGGDAPPADAGLDAPANTVIGTARLHYLAATDETIVDLDLSEFTIAAYVPDEREPSGFRVADGTGSADGTFVINDVPDGVTYYLKVVAPDATGPAFFVTDLHVVDLDRNVGGRVDAEPVALVQPVGLALGNMTPWRSGDLLVAEVAATATEGWNLEEVVVPAPLPDATTLGGSFDWGSTGLTYSAGVDSRPALIEMAKGDVLQIGHAQHRDAFDTSGRVQRVGTTVDLFESAEIEMAPGEPTEISGDFSPVAADRNLRVIVNRAMFDAGYDGSSTRIGIGVAVYGNPAADRGIHLGIPLATVSFEDWSRNTTLSSTVDLVYGDPLPAAWPRSYDLRYARARFYKFPGASVPRQLGMGTTRILPLDPPVPSTPDMQPAGNIQIGGIAAIAGGRLGFDGIAPVAVSWNPVATANHYRLTVFRVFLDGNRTRSTAVSAIETGDAAVAVPAEVFAGGEFFVFQVAAIRNGNTLAQGHLRREGYPYARRG